MMKRVLMGILSAMMAFSVCGCGTPQKEEVDMTKFPFYVEADEAKYEFGFEQMTTPYYKGNVIYNETVLLTKENGKISGKLQYKPVKILSVRDYTWKKEYSADEYTVSGNTITATENSTLPYLLPQNFVGQDIPEPYRQVGSMSEITNLLTDWMQMGATIYTESPLFYGNQISVSYVYDVADVKTNEFADYATSGMPKTKAKLSSGEDVKIVLTGDSVAEGCSASKFYKHEPFMDIWFDLFTQGLNKKYDNHVTSANVAVGGKTAEWGAEVEQTAEIVKEKPDLLIIHFGVNDAGSGFSAKTYSDNIATIINYVQDRLPECEILLVKAFPPIATMYDYKTFERYWEKLDGLAAEIDGVYTLDMYTQGATMLKTKKYMDVTANGINHINDFAIRQYAMNLLASLIEY